MSASPSVFSATRSLVHHSIDTASAETQRHESFLIQKLAISCAILAVSPFFLVFHGAPSSAESLVFALGLLPLIAAVLVARTGRIVLGHAITFLGYIAISLTLLIGVRAGVGCALIWLVVAQIESLNTLDPKAQRLASVCQSAVVCGIVTATFQWDLAPLVASSTASILAGAGVGAALLLTRQYAILTDRARTIEGQDRACWQALVETIDDVAMGLEPDGTVVVVWNGGDTPLGIPRAELLGRGLIERINVADRPLFLTSIAEASHGGSRAELQVRLGSAGSILDVCARAHKLDAAKGGQPVVLLILRDMSAAVTQDETIESARRSIDSAAVSKDQFLANVSHELRTPLNAIIGFSEILASRNLRPTEADKQRDYAQIINQSGQHLLSIVNAILDMSKIQAGSFAIFPEPFALAPLLDQCVEAERGKAQDGKVKIVRDYPGTLGELMGDKRACKRIIANLLSNAIKFTPDYGTVTLQARARGTVLLINVADTGIGINAADLPHIGEPFFQVRASLARPYEGAGLGLATVRGLVGLHGGSMTIESEHGRGTTVSVRLPLDCRLAATKDPGTVIETRSLSPQACSRAFEPRMKQSA